MMPSENILFFGATAPDPVDQTVTGSKTDCNATVVDEFTGLLTSAELKLQESDLLSDPAPALPGLVETVPSGTVQMVLPEASLLPGMEMAITSQVNTGRVVLEETLLPTPSPISDGLAGSDVRGGDSTVTVDNDGSVDIMKVFENSQTVHNTSSLEQVERSLVMEKTPIARNLAAVLPATNSGQKAIHTVAVADMMPALGKPADVVPVSQLSGIAHTPTANQSDLMALETVSVMESEFVSPRVAECSLVPDRASAGQATDPGMALTGGAVKEAMVLEADIDTYSGRNVYAPSLNQLASKLNVKQVRTEMDGTIRPNPHAINANRIMPELMSAPVRSDSRIAPAVCNDLPTTAPSMENSQNVPEPETGNGVLQNTSDTPAITEMTADTNGQLSIVDSEPILLGSTDRAAEHLSTWQITPVDKITPVPVKSETAAVRFVMPPEVNENNIRKGQTITLRLEPEHLGQVRLTLSEHQNSIVGRLVVENHAVRTVVEASLQTLYDQLANEGVDLDAFQVTVGGDGNAPFARRHSNGNPRRMAGGRETSSTAVIGEEHVSPRSGGDLYVNATGVNWVA